MAKGQSNKPSLEIRGIDPDNVPPPLERPAYKGLRDRTTGGFALTAKQEAFARNVAAGMTLAASYRAAYPDLPGLEPKAGKDWVFVQASKTLDLPKVARRVAVLMEEKKREELHDASRLRRFVVERLLKEAVEAGNDGARIRAVELLGKLDYVGLFKPTLESDKAPSADDLAGLKRQLTERLSALLGPSAAPDIESTPMIEAQAIETKE